VLPEDLPRLEASFEQAIAQKATSQSFSYRMRRLDGEIRFIQGSAHFYYDEQGRHTKRVGANLDVSELVTQEARWRAIFEQMHEGFMACQIVYGDDGEPVDFIFLEVNPYWHTATGIPPETIVGSKAYERYPDLEPYWLSIYSRVVRTGDPETFTACVRPLSRWFRVHTYRYAEDRFVALFVDITEQKKLEDDALKAHQRDLRSSRLSAMGAMASTLAHELNQPLAAAVNYLTVAEMSCAAQAKEASAFASAIDGARAAVLRAGEIIKRMRQFTMHGQLDRVPERLSDIVSAAAVEALVGPAGADVLLRIELHDDATTVVADSVQLQQVFSNVFRNSVTAMAKQSGPKQLIVQSSIDRGFVEVKIRDSGPGIPEDRLNKLFVPFTSTDGEGLGLGLALCRTMGSVR
jgi:two-component system sensor kinase FixL